MPVSFHYQIAPFKLKNIRRINDWILLVCYLEKKEIEEIRYVFCDDEYLLQLNQTFLSHNTFTDILTFDYSTKKSIAAEIYISIERVKENAALLNNLFNQELLRVIIHGVLHCIGYGDKNSQLQKEMRQKENKYLKLFEEM